jgi:hypothetical protein
MARPHWLKRRGTDHAETPKQRQQAAINRAGKALEALEARLAAHGTDGLVEWLRVTFGGAEGTVRTCVMTRIVGKSFDRALVDECRGVLS